jgi:hypothetical protein
MRLQKEKKSFGRNTWLARFYFPDENRWILKPRIANSSPGLINTWDMGRRSEW